MKPITTCVFIALLSGCAAKQNFQENFLSANNLFATGEYEQAEGALDDAIDQRKTFGAYHLRGLTKIAQGNFEGGIVDYSKAIQLNPSHQPSYTERGLAKVAKEDFTGALKDLDRAIELKDNDEVAFYNRGNVLVTLGDLRAADKDYSSAININNTLAAAFYNRHLVRRKLGFDKAAEEDLKAARSLGVSEELFETISREN